MNINPNKVVISANHNQTPEQHECKQKNTDNNQIGCLDNRTVYKKPLEPILNPAKESQNSIDNPTTQSKKNKKSKHCRKKTKERTVQLTQPENITAKSDELSHISTNSPTKPDTLLKKNEVGVAFPEDKAPTEEHRSQNTKILAPATQDREVINEYHEGKVHKLSSNDKLIIDKEITSSSDNMEQLNYNSKVASQEKSANEEKLAKRNWVLDFLFKDAKGIGVADRLESVAMEFIDAIYPVEMSPDDPYMHIIDDNVELIHQLMVNQDLGQVDDQTLSRLEEILTILYINFLKWEVIQYNKIYGETKTKKEIEREQEIATWHTHILLDSIEALIKIPKMQPPQPSKFEKILNFLFNRKPKCDGPTEDEVASMLQRANAYLQDNFEFVFDLPRELLTRRPLPWESGSTTPEGHEIRRYVQKTLEERKIDPKIFSSDENEAQEAIQNTRKRLEGF